MALSVYLGAAACWGGFLSGDEIQPTAQRAGLGVLSITQSGRAVDQHGTPIGEIAVIGCRGRAFSSVLDILQFRDRSDDGGRGDGLRQHIGPPLSTRLRQAPAIASGPAGR